MGGRDEPLVLGRPALLCGFWLGCFVGFFVLRFEAFFLFKFTKANLRKAWAARWVSQQKRKKNK